MHATHSPIHTTLVYTSALTSQLLRSPQMSVMFSVHCCGLLAALGYVVGVRGDVVGVRCSHEAPSIDVDFFLCPRLTDLPPTLVLFGNFEVKKGSVRNRTDSLPASARSSSAARVYSAQQRVSP